MSFPIHSVYTILHDAIHCSNIRQQYCTRETALLF